MTGAASPVPGTVLLDAIAKAARQLADAGIDSARANAELIAAHVHQVPRGQLHRVPDTGFDQRYWEDVDRRAAGEPLQHITGRAYFRYLELEVGPGVFVPRPETEEVTGWAISWLRASDAPQAVEAAPGPGTRDRTGPLVVDLGTGSGAIALAIADEVPRAQVHAVEAQRLAAAWAERNLTRVPAGRRVTLHRTPVTEVTEGTEGVALLPELDAAVDLVISNPPYIPDGSWVQPEVGDYDPPEALWGGPDGLDVIKVVERAAARLLRPGGAAVVEHGAPQGTAARAVFARTGHWHDIATHQDLAGRDRFVTALRAGDAPAKATGTMKQVDPVQHRVQDSGPSEPEAD